MCRIYYFLILLLTAKSFAQQEFHSPKYENLIFEGAGIRGIAYSGVIKELESKGIMPHIKKVGGTSAGAITSLMVSLGYSSDEIYSIISDTKFEKFNDGELMFVGGFSRLYKNFGWYKGDAFTEWLEKIIADKTNNSEITFKELNAKGFKNLYVTATCLNKQKLLILSAETYPNMKVKDAIRISMSVPLYFEAVFIDEEGKVYRKPRKKQNLDVVVDGGITGNFPIFIFDSTSVDSLNRKTRIANNKTLGIRIDTDEQIISDSENQELVSLPVNNLNDYMQAFYIMILENLNRNQLTEEDWKRTISISSVGIGPKVKKLSKAQKESLIESGEIHTASFLQKQLND